MAKLIEQIIRDNLKRIAVIGLAKNTGKTVTLNVLVQECVENGISPGLVSFGRDGEAVDVITLLEKPRIHIPPNACFVTAGKFINPAYINIKDKIPTGIFTVFGETLIFRNGPEWGTAELIGLNKVSALSALLPKLEQHSDIVLIDGALDRRSSAVPSLSDAAVIATGAVIGMSEMDVIKKTKENLMRFEIPELQDSKTMKTAEHLFAERLSGCTAEHGNIIAKGSQDEAVNELNKNSNIQNLFLFGAVTDQKMEEIIKYQKGKGLQVIIKDFTRIFLGSNMMTKMTREKIVMKVLDKLNLSAITVNPTRPFYPDMDSDFLVNELRNFNKNYICYNVLSDEYKLQKV